MYLLPKCLFYFNEVAPLLLIQICASLSCIQEMTIQALVTYFGILYQQENIAPGNIDINTLKKIA